MQLINISILLLFIHFNFIFSIDDDLQMTDDGSTEKQINQ